MQGSMSRPGNCWDHAVVERFFASLKTELIDRRRFLTRQEAQMAILTYIEGFYNRRRRHFTLGYLSPVEFEQQASLVKEGVH
jgi:transposase InsO family protein